jgi:hypothetical protein
MKNKDKKLLEAYSLRLKDNHTWKAPPGYKIIVLDRGAVSLNVPEGWLLAQLEPLELHDQPPPNDNARLTLSFWRLPPGIDWSGLPLAQMLSDAVKGGSKHKILTHGELVKSPRTDLELVWTQYQFRDPKEKREAYSRVALARGWNVQVLVTFDFWVSDLEKFKPAWDEVLRSLQLGRHIDDPTKGAVIH